MNLMSVKLNHGRLMLPLLLSGLCCGAQATTLFDNLNAYSSDASRRIVHFEAMAVDDQGRLLATGKSAQLRKQFATAERIDMQGRTVLPGLIDAHGHVLGLGLSLQTLDLRPSINLAAAVQAIRAYAASRADLPWLLGGGWNQEVWRLGRFPAAADIDAVVSDRPVWLRRVDGHAGWANSKALQLAGITDATPDPAGGKILRDADGHASGVLVDSAMALVEKVIPPASEAIQRKAMEQALQYLASLGLTSVHDAGIGVLQDQFYRQAASSGQLPLRVYGMISGSAEIFDQLAGNGPLTGINKDHYALRSVKLYADGALGSRGAAMLAPYSDAPKDSGLLFHSEAEIANMIAKVATRGFQVNVHAIGDAANRQILDAFAKLDERSRQQLRNRIEHAQVVALQDIPRFRQLDIIPSMQPTHATSDMNMAEARVGHQRIAGAYAWQKFLQQGSRIACGSDFPVESANPMLGIYAAVSRQSTDGQPAGGWYISQAMSLADALRCFTIDAAYAAHQETQLGSLEAGKWADFIVLDRDLMKIPHAQIPALKVLQTWVGGQRVYPRQP